MDRLTDTQLQETFDYCQAQHDPEQWELLALAYSERGYYLNSVYCLDQAKECREEATHAVS